ncbi:MAG: hypothetical protein U0U70_10410 [Chitinophagaceae bacterium]
MRILHAITALLGPILLQAQTGQLILHPTIALPNDSSLSHRLITALDSFLLPAQIPGDENRFVYEKERTETRLLLDELNGIRKSSKFNDTAFYKPYLTNVVPMKDSTYLVQFSYIGVKDNLAYLRGSFQLIAHPSDRVFTFSSLLLQYTRSWKVLRAGTAIFHYRQVINKDKVKEFSQLAASFDQKLKVTGKITELYCCDDLTELQRLTGVDYKSDYNGRTESTWSASAGDRKIILLGNGNGSFAHFDPHDLFHDRLSLVISRSQVNKAVDEGCAYLYGGSWGLPWKEIFKAFKKQVAAGKNINWVDIKETPVYFLTNGFKNNADNIVNALLVKMIEKEKGFAGVWELLKSGPAEKGNGNYYRVLESLTGITKAGYNEKIRELIEQENRSHTD